MPLRIKGVGTSGDVTGLSVWMLSVDVPAEYPGRVAADDVVAEPFGIHRRNLYPECLGPSSDLHAASHTLLNRSRLVRRHVVNHEADQRIGHYVPIALRGGQIRPTSVDCAVVIQAEPQRANLWRPVGADRGQPSKPLSPQVPALCISKDHRPCLSNHSGRVL